MIVGAASEDAEAPERIRREEAGRLVELMGSGSSPRDIARGRCVGQPHDHRPATTCTGQWHMGCLAPRAARQRCATPAVVLAGCGSLSCAAGNVPRRRVRRGHARVASSNERANQWGCVIPLYNAHRCRSSAATRCLEAGPRRYAGARHLAGAISLAASIAGRLLDRCRRCGARQRVGGQQSGMALLGPSQHGLTPRSLRH